MGASLMHLNEFLYLVDIYIFCDSICVVFSFIMLFFLPFLFVGGEVIVYEFVCDLDVHEYLLVVQIFSRN